MSNSLARPYADYFPFGISVAVRNCAFAADIELTQSQYRANFGAPTALSSNDLVAATVNVASTAGLINTFVPGAGTATAIGRNGLVNYDSATKRNGWGRNLTCVASAACVRVLTATGYDYLGQKMQESMTLNGTTTVQGLKAFAYLTQVDIDALQTDVATVSVGFGNKFGLPFAGEALDIELKNGAAAANAGTFTAALADATAATATNADVRGTYLPVTVIPDGTNTFTILYILRRNNLHGNAQFTT